MSEKQEENLKEEVLTEPFAEIGPKMHLLLHTGQLLMENGADSDRTVRDMMRAAAFMGISKDRIHQHVMYTTLMLNVNDTRHSYTEFRKCTKHGVNMTTLSAVSKLTWRALAKGYSLEDFSRQLDHIRSMPRNYPVWLTALGAGAACGGFCKLFGGSWQDFFLTALCAALGFFIRRLVHQLWVQYLCRDCHHVVCDDYAGLGYAVHHRRPELVSAYCLYVVPGAGYTAHQCGR
jgi:uncharacterized membrane protein YjjP (DUF1212 family)